MNERMSFFVTRPPVPVPGTDVGSIPCSAAMRATTGETKVLPLPAAGAATGGAGGAGAGAAATGAGSGSGAGAPAARAREPELARRARGSSSGRDLGAGRRDRREHGPDLDRLSFLDEDLVTTPSAGLGTSVSTLSVEISSSGSSRPIESPTWRSHFVIVPSETETPIWGITTSVWVPVDTFLLLVRSELS